MHFKAKYLANAITPAVTILIRAVRADHKVQGYQIAAYFDRTAARVQVIFANLAENDHWRICADGMKLSDHKLMVKKNNFDLVKLEKVTNVYHSLDVNLFKFLSGQACLGH